MESELKYLEGRIETLEFFERYSVGKEKPFNRIVHTNHVLHALLRYLKLKPEYKQYHEELILVKTKVKTKKKKAKTAVVKVNKSDQKEPDKLSDWSR